MKLGVEKSKVEMSFNPQYAPPSLPGTTPVLMYDKNRHTSKVGYRRPDDINLWLWNDSAELVKVLKFAPPPVSIAIAHRPGEAYPN